MQSTKAGRLAREVGLRPGDQILQCNGITFDGLEFGEAVYHLKVMEYNNACCAVALFCLIDRMLGHFLIPRGEVNFLLTQLGGFFAETTKL